MPIIINEEDEKRYEVLSTSFHTNDAVAMIKTDGFATTRANTPISTVKNMDGNIQVFRLPLELEYWVFSCKRAASVEKNPFPCKVVFGIIDNKFHVEFK
ncbi:hypothetical protein F8165_29110 [Bacillus cereus]|uniref:Group-specific protein n=1 Tax=Bacillus cereus TaxID=1396 RepID=A0AAN5XKN9_BACCE|nr:MULTISPECIES: hypothetical protein [Bacillus cereus group]KAB2446153.1 hypothetical protein F8165_29110 [Bacillus cereus]MCU5132719.1 hypothetical protein [Bacillus cereus]